MPYARQQPARAVPSARAAQDFAWAGDVRLIACLRVRTASWFQTPQTASQLHMSHAATRHSTPAPGVSEALEVVGCGAQAAAAASSAEESAILAAKHAGEANTANARAAAISAAQSYNLVRPGTFLGWVDVVHQCSLVHRAFKFPKKMHSHLSCLVYSTSSHEPVCAVSCVARPRSGVELAALCALCYCSAEEAAVRTG